LIGEGEDDSFEIEREKDFLGRRGRRRGRREGRRAEGVRRDEEEERRERAEGEILSRVSRVQASKSRGLL